MLVMSAERERAGDDWLDALALAVKVLASCGKYETRHCDARGRPRARPMRQGRQPLTCAEVSRQVRAYRLWQVAKRRDGTTQTAFTEARGISISDLDVGRRLMDELKLPQIK